MSRFENAMEVLSAAEEIIAQLDEDYKKARAAESVLHVSKTKVKSALEYIRSALEYIAQDVWASYTKKGNSVYFPYGKDEVEFLKSVKKNLPALDEQAPKLFSIIRSIQPFCCGDEWLVSVCKASNFNKHNGLSAQVRKQSKSNVININGFGTFSNCEGLILDNCSFNGIPIAKSNRMVLSNSMPTSELQDQISEGIVLSREFDWVEFHFEDYGVDVLLLITKAHSAVLDLVVQVNNEINGRDI
ncbi:hypothetical protein [Pseudomonas sp. Q1]|uniref:hypothetical protein n=1 Tax=Pseudomonas sp. Q1 TaxID=2202823 RepID=UPI001375077B|nr:hypothetical protein [Pseudomonas sp. Q1]NCE83486.1 hypothetical protein [Pseudomonas sp. Q1]